MHYHLQVKETGQKVQDSFPTFAHAIARAAVIKSEYPDLIFRPYSCEGDCDAIDNRSYLRRIWKLGDTTRCAVRTETNGSESKAA